MPLLWMIAVITSTACPVRSGLTAFCFLILKFLSLSFWICGSLQSEPPCCSVYCKCPQKEEPLTDLPKGNWLNWRSILLCRRGELICLNCEHREHKPYAFYQEGGALFIHCFLNYFVRLFGFMSTKPFFLKHFWIWVRLSQTESTQMALSHPWFICDDMLVRNTLWKEMENMDYDTTRGPHRHHWSSGPYVG